MYKTYLRNFDVLFCYFGSCFVALSVFLQLWLGPVHGMVVSMNLRPFMVSNCGQNNVSSNIKI